MSIIKGYNNQKDDTRNRKANKKSIKPDFL